MSKFNFYRGNDQFKLANELEQILIDQPLSPMEEEIIVVQTKGLERWFRLKFSERNVICAGINFFSPVGFINFLYNFLFNKIKKESVFDVDNLKWTILKILTEKIDKKEFEKLKNYIDNNEIKAFKLSEEIADLFDQYFVSRADMIESWEKDKSVFDVSITTDEIWQKALFLEIVKEFGNDHALTRLNKLLNKIVESPKLPFKRVSFFGFSSLLPGHLHILEQLSEKIEINLFFFDPGMNSFWTESLNKRQKEKIKFKSFYLGKEEESLYLDGGNELLNSWGMLGKEFLTVLFNFNFNKEIECTLEKKSTTLLSKIQSDIFNDYDRSFDNNDSKTTKKDDSLQIASSHSKVREVEILHNYLLSCFDKGGMENLSNDEILVMVPNIDDYASYIKAVFSNVHKNHEIPFTIADAKKFNESSCSDYYLDLLRVLIGRFEISKIIALLEFPIIREKFSISKQDLEDIKGWLNKSNICWGIDGEHKKEHYFPHYKEHKKEDSLPNYEENTWIYGIKRMLMGYAVSNEELVDGIMPFTAIEGNAATVLGNFIDFFNSLQHAKNSIESKKNLSTWKLHLVKILNDFFLTNKDSETELGYIESTVSKLDIFNSTCNLKFDLSFETILSWLDSYLKRDQSEVGFISGRVTFCSMIPMRTIPFRLICILGLNDKDFPRQEIFHGFNLMKKNNRYLDRDLKKSDRYLFLEALLSAKERFYLSFNGRDIKDNTEKQPSIILSEFLDYIKHSFNITDLIVEHPMTSFSKKYFSNEESLFSYSKEDAKTATVFVKDVKEDVFPEENDTSIETIEIKLDDVITFFKNPMKYFLTRNMGVFYKTTNDVLSDEELFELNSLETYIIQDDIIQKLKDHALKNNDAYSFLNAMGTLPHGNLGKVVYNKTEEEVENLFEKVKSEMDKTEEKITASIEFLINKKTVKLHGIVKNIYDQKRIYFRPTSEAKGKDFVELRINHLFINCSSRSDTTGGVADLKDSYFYGKKSKKPLMLNGMEAKVAKNRLEELITLYLKYQNKPMPFIPSIAYDYFKEKNTIKTLQKTQNEKEALQKAQEKWEQEGDYGNYDNQDIYFNICMNYFNIFENKKAMHEFIKIVDYVFGKDEVK